MCQDARLVSDYLVFPGFSGNPLDGADLALLYVKRPVNKTLPLLPRSDGFLGDGQRLVGLGWGVTGPFGITPFFAQELTLVFVRDQ